MMRAPPSPTAHQNFNFFSPHSSHPEYSYEYPPFMVQQNQPKYPSVDKRRVQQPISYSQPQSYSNPPAYAFNMQTGFSQAPGLSLQQTATPDSSRRQTPVHSPARQFVGSSAGDWPAMYVPTSGPAQQFGGYTSTAEMAPTQYVPKIETNNFLAPYNSQSMGRIRSEGSQHDDLPPLSASSRPSVSEGGLFSPLTPSSNPEMDDLGHAAIHMSETVPKSEPSMEGYQFAAVAPHTQSQPRHLPSRRMSPAAANIPNLYHQAQTQHSMDRTSHGISDSQHSPFRASSPFHPGRNVPASPVRHSAHLMPNLGYSAQREADRIIRTEAERVQSTPKTISPKEAFLEYHEPEDESSKINLFAPTPSDSLNEDMMSQASNNDQQAQFDFMGANHGMDFTGNFDFDAPAMPGIPHDYQYHGSQHMMNSKPQVPKDHTTGPYACVVPGCSQRFPTPAKLQKHRRDVHRQTTPTSMGGHGMTSTAHIPKSHIPGPHKCTRINPTTGKPCNTIFSRPYDLTRHEDTIHNTSREKARCEICNDEKTFSRQDALTRHKKVKHGIDK